MSINVDKNITQVNVDTSTNIVNVENPITQVTVSTSTPTITISQIGLTGRDGTSGTSGLSGTNGISMGISLSELKTIVSQSIDFQDFQIRLAAI